MLGVGLLVKTSKKSPKGGIRREKDYKVGNRSGHDVGRDVYGRPGRCSSFGLL